METCIELRQERLYEPGESFQQGSFLVKQRTSAQNIAWTELTMPRESPGRAVREHWFVIGFSAVAACSMQFSGPTSSTARRLITLIHVVGASGVHVFSRFARLQNNSKIRP